MQRVATLLVVLALVGCGRSTPPVSTERSSPQGPVAQSPVQSDQPLQTQPAPSPPDPEPNLSGKNGRQLAQLTRDQMRAGLLRLLNEPGGEGLAKVKQLLSQDELRDRPGTQVYVEADQDGDGQQELVAALPTTEQSAGAARRSGALFVLYRHDGQWAVDRSDPMDAEHEAFYSTAPALYAVADLAGAGHPQIVWLRPMSINTGPQPFMVFVTRWQPGTFTQLPGNMGLSFSSAVPFLSVDGNDLLLTGTSRMWWPAIRDWTDRYRFINGTFRLVDRRFVNSGQTGDEQFWDGLLAEDAGRIDDAVQAYRTAADPGRPAHSGTYRRCNMPPAQLSEGELAQFATALRSFARFRLGTLLLQVGRRDEAQAVLQSDGGAYDGLTAAMRSAPNREAGCKAAAEWATADPAFLKALKVGGILPWTSELLCTHPSF